MKRSSKDLLLFTRAQHLSMRIAGIKYNKEMEEKAKNHEYEKKSWKPPENKEVLKASLCIALTYSTFL